MLKKIKNEIKNNYKYYLILIFLLIIFNINFDYYVYSPGSLINLNNRINIENKYESKGSFNLTYVSARKSNIIGILLSYILPSWDLEKISESRIDDESRKDIELRNQILLKQTSYDAIISAFKEANLDYEITNQTLYVLHTYDYAKTDLKVGDIILSVNNKKINSFEDFTSIISSLNVNDEVKIKVLRNNKEKELKSKIIENDNKKVVGILLTYLKEVNTNPKVEYVFKDNESGSSRGLMCALEIYNKITALDLTNGDIIAGTGTIDENGNVGAIDGIKYKLIGAVKKKAKVFIVPSENFQEAKKIKEKHNYNIELIEADNLHNVIEKLLKRINW